MGLISDFLLVDPAEFATRFPGWVKPRPGWVPSDEDGTPAELEGLDRVECNNVDPTRLERLVASLVPGAAPSDALASESAEQILSVLPTAAVETMAAHEGAALDAWIDKVIEAWRADIRAEPTGTTRDVELSSCTREEWEPLLSSLVQLARRCDGPKVMAVFYSL